MAKKDEKVDTADAVNDAEQPVERVKPIKHDETIPGGKYVSTDGRMVNANGQPIDEEGTVLDGSSTPVVDIPAPLPPPTQ